MHFGWLAKNSLSSFFPTFISTQMSSFDNSLLHSHWAHFFHNFIFIYFWSERVQYAWHINTIWPHLKCFLFVSNCNTRGKGEDWDIRFSKTLMMQKVTELVVLRMKTDSSSVQTLPTFTSMHIWPNTVCQIGYFIQCKVRS